MIEDSDHTAVAERSASMLAELATLYGEVPNPRVWRGDAVIALLYVVIGVLVALFYDFYRLTPGPLMYLILGGYVVPPVAKVALRVHQERTRANEHREYLMTLAQRLRELPRAELLTRLAAVVHRGESSITGVVRTVESIASGDLMIQKAVHEPKDAEFHERHTPTEHTHAKR